MAHGFTNVLNAMVPIMTKFWESVNGIPDKRSISAHHHSETFCANAEWKDLQSICNQHRSVRKIVEEIKQIRIPWSNFVEESSSFSFLKK